MSPQLLPACYSIFLIHAAFLCFRSLHGVELLHLPLQFGSKQKGVTFRCLCSASQCKTWEHSDYSEELLEEACEAGWHNEGGTWTCTGVACPTYQAIQSVTLIFSRSFLHMCKLSAPSSSVLDNIPMGGCKGQVARVAFLHALFKVIQEWFKLCQWEWFKKKRVAQVMNGNVWSQAVNFFSFYAHCFCVLAAAFIFL